MTTPKPVVVRSVARETAALFERVELDELPMPYGIEPDEETGGIQVSWILSDDKPGTRAVLQSFSHCPWTFHAASSTREPIVEFTYEGASGVSNEVVVHCQPNAIRANVELS